MLNRDYFNKTFKVYADGGGYGPSAYGSFEVVYNGFKKRCHRISFSHWHGFRDQECSSNVAEYLAVLSGLEWLESVHDKQLYRVQVFTDSLLVVNQIRGVFKCRKEQLRMLCDDSNVLLCQYGNWTVNKVRRNVMVEIFGH